MRSTPLPRSTPNITTTMHILTHPAHFGECAVRLKKKHMRKNLKLVQKIKPYSFVFKDKFLKINE